MKKTISTLSLIAGAIGIFFLSIVDQASAHEVYVLGKTVISYDVSAYSPNPFIAAGAQPIQFAQWGCLVASIILLTIAFSLNQKVIQIFKPFLTRFKKYAPLVGRITLGISLIASGYFDSFFGPELPQSAVSSHAHLFSITMILIGSAIFFGFLTRLASLIGIILFAIAVFVFGSYTLTYANYLGEMLLALIIGGGLYSVDSFFPSRLFQQVNTFFDEYAFLILRITFGAAVFYASFYAKFLHSDLILDTIKDYHLTLYFPFTPLFLALGAFLIEAILGFCFFIGFQVRFAALFFTVFLTLSLSFFGEVVWPHIILFGINATLFLHGYDKYTLNYWLARWNNIEGEPAL